MLRAGALLDTALAERIKAQIREHTTPRHVPRRIIALGDIPRTLNGKKVELAVRAPHRRPDGAERGTSVDTLRDLIDGHAQVRPDAPLLIQPSNRSRPHTICAARPAG